MRLIGPDRFRESFEVYSAIGATDRDGLHGSALSAPAAGAEVFARTTRRLATTAGSDGEAR